MLATFNRREKEFKPTPGTVREASAYGEQFALHINDRGHGRYHQQKKLEDTESIGLGLSSVAPLASHSNDTHRAAGHKARPNISWKPVHNMELLGKHYSEKALKSHNQLEFANVPQKGTPASQSPTGPRREVPRCLSAPAPQLGFLAVGLHPDFRQSMGAM